MNPFLFGRVPAIRPGRVLRFNPRRLLPIQTAVSSGTGSTERRKPPRDFRFARSRAVLAALLFLIAVEPSVSAPVPVPVPAAICAISAPESGFPGDCAVVTFRRYAETAPISGGTVRLISASGAVVARATAFIAAGPALPVLSLPAARALPSFQKTQPETPLSPDSPTLAALLPLPVDLAAEDYGIEAACLIGGKPVVERFPFKVFEKAFPSEEIALNAANAAIKKDLSPRRLAQIKSLNEILFRRDPAAPRFAGPFVAPIRPSRVTSAFAHRRLWRYTDGSIERSTHYGIDYGIPTGTLVRASGDGLVVMTERRVSTGWTLVIEHLPGMYSLYYHLDAILTIKGSSVAAGDPIARSGATGLATGPHLHWEIRVNGEAVSPNWFVGKRLF